jgi:hypothetical protein
MSPHTSTCSPDAVHATPDTDRRITSVSGADLLGRVVAARDLGQRPFTPPAWFWQGYLGAGKVTLLTSQWKSGKTTLLALLLARLQQGGQLAGLPVAQGKALVISEESEADWQPRCQLLGIRDHVDLLCRPFTTQPTMDQWLALMDTAAALHDRQGTDLIVIDSLAQFLPGHCENSAGALLECLTPLQRLATAGMSVCLSHHPHKGKTVAGQAARGSGALCSFVDILIEMGYHTHPDDLDRRRRLLAFSRYDQTPRHLLMELTADGRDYALLQSGWEAAVGESWQAVLATLSTAHTKLTRQEILDNWSGDFDKPDATTLWRWLSRAVSLGQVRHQGTGRANDPFRYWLPSREEMLYPEGGTMEELCAWNARWTAELLDRLESENAKKRAPEARHSVVEASPPEMPDSAPEEAPSPGDPVPLPEGDGETAPAASTVPASPPSQAAEPMALATPQAPVALPYPFNLMNPADVPEEVWNRARAAQGNG